MLVTEGADGILLSLRKRAETSQNIGKYLHMSSCARDAQRTRLALYRLEQIVKAELKKENYYPDFPPMAYRLKHDNSDQEIRLQD